MARPPSLDVRNTNNGFQSAQPAADATADGGAVVAPGGDATLLDEKPALIVKTAVQSSSHVSLTTAVWTPER